MPISYSIDETRQLILEVWTGNITAAVLRSYWTKYLADPEVLAIRRTLVDLRQCDLVLTGRDMWDLVDAVVVPKLGGLDWKTAIVVGSPDQYGFSRQYQVFAERYSSDSIFHDYDRALDWILTRDDAAHDQDGDPGSA